MSRIEEDRYVRLDKFTVRSLELVGTMNDEGTSLLDVIGDKTVSPMGSRMLRRWVLFPLKDVKPIQERQNVVDYFFRHPEVKEILDEQIEQIGDLTYYFKGSGRPCLSPGSGATESCSPAIEPIKEACMASDEPSLSRVGEQLNACTEIRDRIEKEINNDPPALLNKGGVIAKGINAELDELRAIAYSGKDYLLKVQQRESEKTGIFRV